MIAISTDKPPAIPANVATCPICNAPIEIVELTEWEVETGKVTDGGLKVDCTTAPDVDSDEWEDWFHGHWSMPYVDWMPVEDKVLDWFNENYRIAESER